MSPLPAAEPEFPAFALCAAADCAREPKLPADTRVQSPISFFNRTDLKEILKKSFTSFDAGILINDS